ncbi:MAG: response regulator [Magnetococcus sp. MYC-9]
MSGDVILVVEDERLIFEAIEETLGDAYVLHHAKEGVAGLRMYEQLRPILVILDLHMPVMDGFAFLKRIQITPQSPCSVIVLSGHGIGQDASACYKLGVTAFLRKPFDVFELKSLVEQSILAKKNYLALEHHRNKLEEIVGQRTAQLSEKIEALERTETALREAMGNLLAVRVMPGVFWLQIPEAGLYILCGCPGEVVKHLMRQGLIHTVDKAGVTCETGPNVVLLSELLVQNGGFANLAEFPVLQMLYRQGMILPGHPNNTGVKPMLIGAATQVRAQMEYIHRGNVGLDCREEILACGLDAETAENMMRVKLKFAFGTIRPPSQLLDTLEVGEQAVEIRNGVTVCRIGFNRYQFAFQGRTTEIDLNLPPNVLYPPAYSLGHYRFERQYFAVLHRGEGDGWDVNRPSTGGVIMFQGRIYLVDAGPGVFYNMLALGIDISEVEGIFHTHNHDDHFGGLPALIHSGHRLKYFATPLVRSAVAKKFTALMSLDEEKFGQFFEICDLVFDTWNDCDGLEVMPLYSPHPTDTNIFLFRALDVDGYKSYAHWADLTSFHVLDGMTGRGPADVPASFMAKVKRDYLLPADLKKLDIGGGMIHGVAEDFRNDPSDRLILAHIGRKLTAEEMEIGSESSFGALDVLIAGEQHYLHQRAFGCLRALFPEVKTSQIRMLLNCPLVEYNAGTILHRPGENTHHVLMILAGTVAYLESASGTLNHLSFGSLVGEAALFGKREILKGTYRAVSHCSVLRFSTELFRIFLTHNHLLTHMEELLDKIWFLRKTWLFGGQIPFVSLGNISRAFEPCSLPVGKELSLAVDPPRLWLVVEGEVRMEDGAGNSLESIKTGGFFGEHRYFSVEDFPWRCTATTSATLYSLALPELLSIPIVHWKMLEIFEKRKKRALAFHTSAP